MTCRSLLYNLRHSESLEASEPNTPERASNPSIPAPVDVIPPMESGCGCSSNLEMSPRSEISSLNSGYVYAIGRVNLRFPNLSVEKEFAQATGRAETAGLTDRQLMHSVLSKRENRYLVHKMCWVLSIEGQDSYVLQPAHPEGYNLLVESLRSTPRLTDVDVVIGTIAPPPLPEICNGLLVPVVKFDQSYSFDVDSLIKSIPKPGKAEDTRFKEAAEELFWRVMQMADNKGDTDIHRALNYLVVRYPEVYTRTAEAHASNSSLKSVHAETSRLSGVRKIIDVIFSFNHRQTDVEEKYFVRVDVTEEFPFLVTKMSPYYER
jgi:PatG Domain